MNHVVKSQTKNLSACITNIVNELETRNNTSKIEKTFIEVNKKFSTHISEVNVNPTAAEIHCGTW